MRLLWHNVSYLDMHFNICGAQRFQIYNSNYALPLKTNSSHAQCGTELSIIKGKHIWVNMWLMHIWMLLTVELLFCIAASTEEELHKESRPLHSISSMFPLSTFVTFWLLTVYECPFQRSPQRVVCFRKWFSAACIRSLGRVRHASRNNWVRARTQWGDM